MVTVEFIVRTSVVTDVTVVVGPVAVETDVTVRSLALPTMKPAPAPTRMATTSSPATAAPLMDTKNRMVERAIRLVTRTA